jgi:hypothetical protein
LAIASANSEKEVGNSRLVVVAEVSGLARPCSYMEEAMAVPAPSIRRKPLPPL